MVHGLDPQFRFHPTFELFTQIPLLWFGVILCTHKLTPKDTCPHFIPFKYDSDGQNSVYCVKNTERMGKTTYECKVTMSSSKKEGILTNFRQAGRGKFPRGRVCAQVNLTPPFNAHIVSVLSVIFQGFTCPYFIENIYFLNSHSFQASSHQCTTTSI